MAQMISNTIIMPTFKKTSSSPNKENTVYHIPIGDPMTPSGLGKRLCSTTPLPQFPAVDIEFSDIECTVPDRKRGSKRILCGLSGAFFSSKLTAVMGPSGSGKSTLLNILAGHTTKGVSGSVMVNGVDAKSVGLHKMVSYIMQEDQLMPNLTVMEAMNIAASLKLGKQFSKKSKAMIVEEVLETLRMGDCRDTKTENLSGGQKKRLSIALELVNNPSVMFYDEPTSGLDSSACFQFISLLRSLAHGGRTIVCSIHQPSARLFEMFDHLYTIADGQCIYQGTVKGVVPFLSSMGLHCPSFHNPADYIIEVAVGEHGDVVPRLVNAVETIMKCGPYIEKQGQQQIKEARVPGLTKDGSKEGFQVPCKMFDSSQYAVSRLSQFWILWKRTNICTMRDMALFWIRWATHVLTGLLFGTIYLNVGSDASQVVNNSSCVFFTVLFLMFTSMMPTITTFPLEKKVFFKETKNHWYALFPYYLAKTIGDFPFQVFFTMSYVGIAYYMTDQPLELFRISMFFLSCFLISIVAQSVGLFIGSAMSVEKGVYVGPISCLPLLLFSGFFVSIDRLPYALQWIGHLSFVSYSFQNGMISVYGFDRPPLQCPEPYCPFKSPARYLKEIHIEEANFASNCVWLLGYFALFRLLSFIVLKWSLSSRR